MKKSYLRWLMMVLVSLGTVALANVDQDADKNDDVLCGGIGEDERIALQTTRGSDPLRLVFSTQVNGEYLADVAVLVQKTDGGQRRTFLANGPLCYVRLPAGSYRVQADFKGIIKTLSVRIEPRRIRTLYFYWHLEGVD